MAAATSSWSWSPWGWWSTSPAQDATVVTETGSSVAAIPAPPYDNVAPQEQKKTVIILNAARNAPPHMVTSQQIKQAVLQKNPNNAKNINHVSQNDVVSVLTRLKKTEVPPRKTVFEPRSPVLRELLRATEHRRLTYLK